MKINVLDTKEQSVRACKLHFECSENVVQGKHTALYEKGIKQNQNKPMETTCVT